MWYLRLLIVWIQQLTAHGKNIVPLWPRQIIRQKTSQKIHKLPKCELCSESHQWFKCEVFKAMNSNVGKNYIRENHLCKKCLLEGHDRPWKNTSCNRACPRCQPEEKYHNSMICSNKEASVLLARETQGKGKKRSHQVWSINHTCGRIKELTITSQRHNRHEKSNALLKNKSFVCSITSTCRNQFTNLCQADRELEFSHDLNLSENARNFYKHEFFNQLNFGRRTS